MKQLFAISILAPFLAVAQAPHTFGPIIAEQGTNNLGTAAGTNTYTASAPSPIVLAAYNAGACFTATFTNGNTSAATLNVNSLGAIAIKKTVSSALASGDIGAGSIHTVCYDGTNFQLDHTDAGAGGGGTVTSISAGCGLTTGGGAITGSGTISQATAITVKTADYVILSTDMCGVLDMNSASAHTFTLAQAGTTGFEAAKFIRLRNINAGVVTISTTTSTFIGGGYSGSSLTLVPNRIFLLQSDGTNWNVLSDGRIRAIPFTVGDVTNSSALTTSNVSYMTIPFSCTLAAWNLAIDAGTITVKFWKVATGTAIPTSGASINTSGVAISTGTAIHSNTMSDFTATAVAANDIMAMAVTAVATAKFANGVLECDQ